MDELHSLLFYKLWFLLLRLLYISDHIDAIFDMYDVKNKSTIQMYSMHCNRDYKTTALSVYWYWQHHLRTLCWLLNLTQLLTKTNIDLCEEQLNQNFNTQLEIGHRPARNIIFLLSILEKNDVNKTCRSCFEELFLFVKILCQP